MVVLESWKQFLAEVVAILINQEWRKIICIYDLVNQEVDKPLNLHLLGVAHALAERKWFLKIFRALFCQDLGNQLSWIQKRWHYFLGVRVVGARRVVSSLRAVVLRLLLLLDVFEVLWDFHLHLPIEIIGWLLVVVLFIWAIFIIFWFVELQWLDCKLAESPPIVKLAASALRVAFDVYRFGRATDTVCSILSRFHLFCVLRHDPELLSKL